MYDGKLLLSIARASLTDYFASCCGGPEAGGGRHGSFVTLRKGGALRGCIGYMSAVDELYPQTYRLAREAAFQDWRFEPVRKEELGSILIEVSVLSPMREIAGLDDFCLGRDGILMSLGTRRAVFLPEVAKETGWSKSELLSALSRKAGLPADAYKSPDCSFMTFTSEVFNEV